MRARIDRVGRVRHLVSLVPLVVLGLACRACWLPDRNLGRRVADDEVTGTWHMTAASRALLARDGAVLDPDVPLSMTFADDGAARLATVSPNPPHVALVVEGRWTLGHDVSRSSSADVPNLLRLSYGEDDSSVTVLEDWGFVEMDGHLHLWQFLGDPDSWEFVEYVRAK